MVNGKTFIRISNQQVYDELCALKSANDKDHDEIKLMIVGYKGQVMRLYWALAGMGILVISLLGFLINHIGGG